TRGQANGTSAPAAPVDSGTSDTATAEAPAEAPAAQAEQNGSTTEAPRRERRGASRNAGSPSPTADQAEGEGTREGGATRQAKDRQEGQQDTKTDERGQDAGGDQSSGGQQPRGEDDGEGRQGRRGRRFRDRRRRGERTGDGADAELREDDVVQPVAGILDVLDNYAFVRTSGYLAGPHDVYVSMNMVRKNGLRRVDAVTAAVPLPRAGEQP